MEILGVLPGFPAPVSLQSSPDLLARTLRRPESSPACLVSPVYIDNKLVGAIAFSFPFSKEPIAGITPIQQMIDLFEKGSAGEVATSEGAARSFALRN